jgi:hypothetical protein
MLHYVGFLEKHLYVELGEGLSKEAEGKKRFEMMMVDIIWVHPFNRPYRWRCCVLTCVLGNFDVVVYDAADLNIKISVLEF